MDIKKAVLNNLKGRSKEDIKGFIQDVIDKKEENAIPGLGILFEAAWEKMSFDEKENMMNWVMRGLS
ncbi:MAG: small acid-soluble spore protein SspI [Thermoanaerobacteraceae bacterium]